MSTSRFVTVHECIQFDQNLIPAWLHGAARGHGCLLGLATLGPMRVAELPTPLEALPESKSLSFNTDPPLGSVIVR